MSTIIAGISIILIIGLVVSLFFGIRFLIKYRLTRKKSYLVWGIILTFVIPGLLVLLLIGSYYAFNPLIVYGPAPMMEYGPAPA
jgi:hypothetical protein